MSLIAKRLNITLVHTVIFFGGVVGLAAHPMPLAESAKTDSCTAPEYRQFDFWIGDWDVFDVDNPSTTVARVRVDHILDGCVLREDYQGADGMKGQSFSLYDASRKVWHQSWATNRGRLLIIEGERQAGQMVFSGVDRTASGKERQVRGTWQPIGGGVRETAVTSIEGGKTWDPWFELIFRPRVSSADSDDAKIIAELDRQYQAAVQDNDVATMGRILADDFVLVTGSGKSYPKAELLEQARSGQVRYEYQADTDQTVRVWGDTAVVTAKLREKGTEKGNPFDYSLWFSDTYVRTSTGWRYAFGQASLPLPNREK